MKKPQLTVKFIIIVGVWAFVLASLISYNHLDPSWKTLSIPRSGTSNWCGPIGAEISATLMYYFGYASFVLPFVFRRYRTSTLASLGFSYSLLLTVCLWLTAVPTAENLTPLQPLGGLTGSFVGFWVQTTAGKTGMWILLLCLTASLALIPLENQKWLEANLKRVSEWFPGKFEQIWPRGSFLKNFLRAEKPANATVGVTSYAEATENQLMTDFVNPKVEPTLATSFEKRMVEKAKTQIPETGAYKPPSSSGIFDKSLTRTSEQDRREYELTAKLLVDTLAEFGVGGKIISYQSGPVVTVYEFEMKAGIKQSKVMGLCDDLALALKVDSLLIQPVRGKRALGIQVPNQNRSVVTMGDILGSSSFQSAESSLTFVLGKAVDGTPVSTDLASMPHLLIAGATGSGKSVGINALICSILMKSTPDQVRMVLVDPKMLELSVYGKLPHLLMPVITDAEKASSALKWAVNEMESRYAIMQQVGVRNLSSFNDFWQRQTPTERERICEETGVPDLGPYPYILIVIDELADLMLSAAKEVESNIQRLAQKARASGIHMVLATQRPSVDIITGVIKANLPCRIAFQVVSKHDSRTILDQMGAERLMGKGDLLFQRPGFNKLMRVQGAYVSDSEVSKLVSTIGASSTPNFDTEAMEWIDQNTQSSGGKQSGKSGGGELDARWDEAIGIAQSQGFISASYLQRQLKLGYNRAARIVEQMESEGLVEKANGSKPRKWLGSQQQLF